MSYNKKDLCLPYVLCRLGRYYDAYLLYKEMLPKFWDKQLYVLYFISLYNLYCIRYGIFNDVMDKRDIDADVIVKEIEKFDLDLILKQLPIDCEIKRTFCDLIDSSYFSKKSNDAEELYRQIHRQKKQADRGGASINSNFYSLVAKFLQTYNFCVSNSIEFGNAYFYSLITDTASGIILSHITKDNRSNGMFKPTKIESLDWAHVFVLLFFMTTKDLSEVLKLHEVNELIIQDDSLIRLERTITNLYNALYLNDRYVQPDFNIEIISDIIGNIVIILGCSKTQITQDVANKLYKIIHDLWSRPICRSVLTHLHTMVVKYKPSNEMAIDLLDDAIRLERYKSNNIAKIISKQLKEDGVIFDRVSNASVLIDETEGQLGMTLYYILPLSVQIDYMSYVQNNSKRLLVYLMILKQLRVGVSDVNVLEQLLKNPGLTKGYEEEQLTHICWILAEFRKDDMYSNAHYIIDDYGHKYEQYRFYMDPVGYKKIDRIETFWLLRLEDSMLKLLLVSNGVIKEKVKKAS